jgi:hypothetical protein
MQKYIECGSKIINGKKRILFKTSNSKKQYIKFKGDFIALSTYRKLFSSNKKGGSPQLNDGDIVVLYDHTRKGYLAPDTSDNGLYYREFSPTQPAARKLTITQDPNVLWRISKYTGRYEGRIQFSLYKPIDNFSILNSSGVWYNDKEGNVDKGIRLYLTKDPHIRGIDENNHLLKYGQDIPDIEVILKLPSIKDLRSREETGSLRTGSLRTGSLRTGSIRTGQRSYK